MIQQDDTPRCMRRKNCAVRLSILSAVAAAIAVISLSPGRGTYRSFFGTAQGTTYHITYASRKNLNLQPRIDSILADFDMSLSIYEENSIISRFNRNDTLAVADDKFETVFNKSYEVYLKTDGAFDITVAPVVNALGFGPSDTAVVDSMLIDSLMNYIGMDKVSLVNGRLVKKERELMLDVNAIAQGYAVDVVAAYLESLNIKNYMVEIGGEVRARGRNGNNEFWRIGIDKPVEGNMTPGSDLQAIIHLRDRSLATSGNYHRFYEKDGVKYVHTINPKTGYPVISNLLSATIVAEDCMTADAYATAMMVMGLEKSIQFLSENQFLEAYLVFADDKGAFQVYMTPGLHEFMAE